MQFNIRTLTVLILTFSLFDLSCASAMGRAHPQTSSTASPAPKVALVTDPSAPLALVYSGPGSCSVAEGDAGSDGYGCSEAAGDIASTAGFRVQFVGPTDLTASSTQAQVSAIFKNAKVWIQPGGVSVTAYKAMSDKLKSELVNFVGEGGGYVGICAGAFLATSQIGTSTSNGLGIFPGHTQVYKYKPLKYDYALLDVSWQRNNRKIYFEGGPYLYGFGASAEVIGTFTDGAVAAARTTYKKGRVFLTGPHVEAPSNWTAEDGIKDPDGTEYDLGSAMVKWAAGLDSN